MVKRQFVLMLGAAALFGCGLAAASADPLMVFGNDEKLMWDDHGKVVLHENGKDTVVVIDIANPENPKIVATLPLKNSVIGPPVNIDISPDGAIALVADSINVTKEGEVLKNSPDDKIYVIDLKAKPAKLINTITVGKQPSGLSFNKAGNLALVANRADKSISVLSVHGTDIKVVGTVPTDDIVSHVTFTPDGKRALASKFNDHKVTVLSVDGEKVTYDKKNDLPTGLWPYNVAISPTGQIALTADNGNAGNSDGSVDTVSVVDLTASPPRIIDRVVVGDGPEGLAISPKGDLAVAAIIAGTISPGSYFYHKNGHLAVLKIEGKKVTKIKDVEVGGLPEAVMFSPDGKYIYAGNFLDQDISILKVNGADVVNTGKTLKLSGHPASGRMSTK
jgi:DNA-binding beta-propeller fold protein YncE